MDIFDFSTIYTAILTSNILLIIVSVIFCSKKILLNAGYKLIAVFLLLIVVRLFLPIQFPFVTSIPLFPGISKVIIELFVPRLFQESFPISIYDIFIIIWIVGILVKAYDFIRSNQMIKVFIYTFGKNVTKDSPYASIMDNICATDKRLFGIYEIPDIKAPFLYGIRNPFILIPADQNYDHKTLTYILNHEVMHYKHHDLWLKFGVHLLTIIYWWNPCSYILKKQLDLIIEMRIDDTITMAGDKEAFDYLQCLFYLADKRHKILNHKLGNVISFYPGSHTELTRRFDMLMKRNRKKKKGINVLLLCLLSGIYLGSYLVIFEADYVASEIQEISFETSQVNSFAVDNEDGSYDIYMLDIYIDTVTSFEYYDKDLPVLTKEEFERVQQEKSQQD